MQVAHEHKSFLLCAMFDETNHVSCFMKLITCVMSDEYRLFFFLQNVDLSGSQEFYFVYPAKNHVTIKKKGVKNILLNLLKGQQ